MPLSRVSVFPHCPVSFTRVAARYSARHLSPGSTKKGFVCIVVDEIVGSYEYIYPYIKLVLKSTPEIHTCINPHIGLPVCSSSSRVLFVLPLAKFCRLEEHAGD